MKEANANGFISQLFKKPVIITKNKNRNPSLEVKNSTKRERRILPKEIFNKITPLIKIYTEDCPNRRNLLGVSNEEILLNKVLEYKNKEPTILLVKIHGMKYLINIPKKIMSTHEPTGMPEGNRSHMSHQGRNYPKD